MVATNDDILDKLKDIEALLKGFYATENTAKEQITESKVV